MEKMHITGRNKSYNKVQNTIKNKKDLDYLNDLSIILEKSHVRMVNIIIKIMLTI